MQRSVDIMLTLSCFFNLFFFYFVNAVEFETITTSISSNATSNSTEIALIESDSTSTTSSKEIHLRAKRQWGGCRYENCDYYGGCGSRGCGGGCRGGDCGGYGGYGFNRCNNGRCNSYGSNTGCGNNGCVISACNNPICGRMCCTNSEPRPCVGCGMSRQCCPCCMPRCSRQCIRGGCNCDYDYNAGWGRKRRHAIEFKRPISEAEETSTAVAVA